jgi:hypothetical protein
MRKYLLITCCLLWSLSSSAQQFEIIVRDNLAKMNMEQVSKITSDSVVITAVSDQGRSRVNYLNRRLTEKERRIVNDFLKSYPVDSLVQEYFKDYSNFTIIDEEHYPRALEVTVSIGDKRTTSKATNAWVGLYDRLFRMMNTILPSEAAILLDKSKFNVFY